MTREVLVQTFRDDVHTCDCCTWFMRLLTAATMRRQAERFLPFLDDIAASTGDMQDYTQREVLPMGKECEQVHIIALAECLGVQVKIEYMDGRPFEHALGCVLTDIAEGSEGVITISLLYRPGHYDILYDKVNH